MPVRLIYVDDQGREWLVRDGVVQEKKFVPLQLGDHYARFRVFDLKEPRVRRVYLFPKGVQHAVNGPTLESSSLKRPRCARRKGSLTGSTA